MKTFRWFCFLLLINVFITNKFVNAQNDGWALIESLTGGVKDDVSISPDNDIYVIHGHTIWKSSNAGTNYTEVNNKYYFNYRNLASDNGVVLAGTWLRGIH